MRVDYTVSPDLSIQLYAERFTSVGRCRTFREVRDPRVRDFHLRRLRSILVVRWEYRPGSPIYLAWSQDRSGRGYPGGFHLGRDLAGIVDVPARDVLLLKIEHWLGL